MPRRPARPRSAPRAEWPPLAGSRADEEADVVTARPFTLSVRSAAEAAHGAFRDALRDLGRLDDAATDAESDEPGATGAGVAPDLLAEVELDRWGDGGEPLGSLFVGAHRLSRADHEPRAAREFARERVYDCVYAAAGAYARALRREGVGLPAALVAVRETVDAALARDAVFLPLAAFAAVQRDAARCCLEAFYAH
jgi:hypothetical protein